jgi:hypothetical protein
VGLFNAFENGLKGLFGEGFADRAARAMALEGGDFDAAARISKQMEDRQAAKAQTLAVTQALRAQGVPDDQIAIMLTNPDKLGEYYNSRFQPATVDEGSTRVVPNLNGSQTMFTAPKTFQHGADIVQTPLRSSVLGVPSATVPEMGQPMGPPAYDPAKHLPDSDPAVIGAARISGLRTDAEQYADSIASRGTPEWGAAVKDYTLKAYGPSASAMLGQKLSTQEAIAAGRNATSEANNRYRVDHPASRAPGRQPQPKPPTPTTVIGGIMHKQANGEALTPSEAETLREYRTHNRAQPGAPTVGTPVKVNSLDEARRLPPGTVFQTPDGRVKVR